MSGSVRIRDQKILATKSGNRCAMPYCRRKLVVDASGHDDESLVGVMAHIRGEKPGAARYDPAMTDEERNSHRNLIFICANCHKTIDDQETTYTVEKLITIKLDHEKLVNYLTKKEIPEVTFVELDQVTKYLVTGQGTDSVSFTLLSPTEKIKRNELSLAIEQLIKTGLAQAKQVGQYIDRHPDIMYGERLKHGFVDEYRKLRGADGLKGDDLFYALLNFAFNDNDDFTVRAAALSVLVYLFEKCEVFEK